MADSVLKSGAAADQTAKAADPVFKVVPPKPASASRASIAASLFNQYRRLILLVVIPAIVATAALTIYMMGGRYITTDNAYVGAQKF
jgi:membrane fusion protein (multidrug efflux system)